MTNSVKTTSTKEAKMSEIANQLLAKTKELKLPLFNVVTSDELGSSIRIKGSFDPQETWLSGFVENSRYFVIDIIPHSGKYYYDGGQVMMKLIYISQIESGFEKYTSTPDKVTEELINWINLVR